MTGLFRWALGLVAVLSVGCGVDPGDSWLVGGGGSGGTGGEGGTGGGPGCPEDPADGPVPPECGVWVSTTLGDDANDGTQGAPVATLTQAIALAAKGPPRVYACNETWTEAVVVPGHVSLHGGFDCANGWAYSSDEGRRAILASASPIAMTWVESDKGGKPFLTDFHVESADAVEPGGSSIALFVTGDVPAFLRRCEIVAGDGAGGLDGEPGAPGDEPATPGAPGSHGANACSAAVSKGGVAPESACPTGVSKGGAGGDAGAMTAASGAPGEPAGEPAAGMGGVGQQMSAACTSGGAGAQGLNGVDGAGAVIEQIRLTVDGYIGATGEDGKVGAPGQGGGGGGASLGSTVVCGAATPGGAAGGSGGAGGCGGKGGRGGRPGGASLAIATFGQLTIVQTHMVAGRGGNGGNGGPPQDGGTGALPGQGGVGAGSIQPGCAGGQGGSGGKGGWGGGGVGGLSLCLATAKGVVGALFPEGTDLTQGTGGKGGIGNPADLDTDGDDGYGATSNILPP